MFGFVSNAQILAKLSAIAAQLAIVQAKQETLMAAIDELKASVAAEDTVIGSAVTLISGFSARLTAAGTDPAALAALKADIDGQAQSLAAAVAANTPAAAAT